MKQKFINYYMRVAFETAQLSYAQKKKVGCIIVKEDKIISIGYNGTPKGWSNVCEDEKGQTLPIVLHAEFNALGKLTGSTESAKGSSIFITLSPCIQCAKLIQVSGVKYVFYADRYRDINGLKYLEQCDVHCYQVDTKKPTTHHK